MVEKRAVRYSIKPGTYCDIDALCSAVRKTEKSQTEIYVRVRQLLKNPVHGQMKNVDALLKEADISTIFGNYVSSCFWSVYFLVESCFSIFHQFETGKIEFKNQYYAVGY